MKIKKMLSFILSLVFVMSMAVVPNSFSVYAETDTEKPVIDLSTLTVSKKTATVGDTVRISVKITDNVRVSSASLKFIRPQSKKEDSFLYMKYDIDSDRFIYDFKVTDSTESGEWKVSGISCWDSSDLYTSCSSNLSAANFTVSTTSNPFDERYDFEVEIGKTLSLSYEANCDIYWRSSDPSIAKIGNTSASIISIGSYKKVVSSCEIIPIKEGIVTIYATDSDGYALNSAKVKVTKAKILIGDVTNDGIINSNDALAVLRYSVGQNTLTDNQFAAGDVSRDGIVNSVDALKILQYSVGQITEF